MWSWVWIPIVNVRSEWSNKQTNNSTGPLQTCYPFTYELCRFWFWFGWPYSLYSEFLSTTLARIASAALKLKWQSAKQLVVVSLIHVVKERNLNKVWVNQKGLSIYFTLVPVLDFSVKNDVSSFPNVTTAETCTVHIPKTSEWVTPILIFSGKLLIRQKINQCFIHTFWESLCRISNQQKRNTGKLKQIALQLQRVRFNTGVVYKLLKCI